MTGAETWWLYNTAAGRKTLERILPLGAIPAPVKRRMCVDQGHDDDPLTGVCRRCGQKGTK